MTRERYGIKDDRPLFWFNTRTGEVEEGPQSLALDRIGPFDTPEEAARAPEIVRDRAAQWEAEDEAAWRGE